MAHKRRKTAGGDGKCQSADTDVDCDFVPDVQCAMHSVVCGHENFIRHMQMCQLYLQYFDTFRHLLP